ncbi:deacylase [Martelella alba]|uniref:Deacylase n=1 Tax=Martelella alba TaxID=2590451 RepID=A0A506U1N2_9HYPH|nr:succinylglutamate desuccinylase/aspartoacylase family protein [Martelella alba]TPW28282.1 deacylase [Martelella alba]
MHTGVFHDLDLSAEGKSISYISIPMSVDRSPYFQVKVPVVTLKNGDGPRILLMAGNHGDEYEGEITLSRLSRLLTPEMIRGSVTIIPFTNAPAVMAARRCSPLDGGNLNRAFPGDNAGTPTQRIAYFLEHTLFPAHDVVFDIHAGGTSMEHLGCALIEHMADPKQHEKALELMQAMGLSYGFVAENGVDAPTSMAAAARAGAIGISGEFGGCATASVTSIRLTSMAIDRVLMTLGIVDRPVLNAALPAAEPMTLLALKTHRQAIYATRRGWYEPAVSLGDTVKAGDLAGWYHDFERLELAEEPLYFQESGVVLSRRLHTDSQAGDCLIQVALFA